MKLSFRDYAQGDEETYVNIHNERYKTCTWFSKHGPITVSNAKQEIEEKKKNPTYRLIFALTQDQPIGFIEASMEDANTGQIHHYSPCILPTSPQLEVSSALVEAAIKHLEEQGAQKLKYSIMGRPSDTTPYIELYQALDFKIVRKALIMWKKLDTPPEYTTPLLIKLATLNQVNADCFVDLFMKCFQDSKDRDAAQIASNIEQTKKFIQQLREREGSNHDPDGWIAASLNGEYVGFTIAVQQGTDGLIAEVGVAPQFRRSGIGTYLTLKGLERLKERGFKQASLGVDVENTAAIALYDKLGFEKLPFEVYELEKAITP
ncbi:MAG TPA: GNAT family N-acetyltransferase [Candidatus Bathyarchaeia archaeon]|nr:GNAT family N-acetyltransferase [Candidatus Bathyarchaeia archaeon]